jgi:hypothetical protein
MLMERYLECWRKRGENSQTFQDVVKDLLRLGVERQELVERAVEVGYSRAYVRSLLCRILITAGIRVRKRRAGRETRPEVLAILYLVRNRYGDSRAGNLLRAAYRA